MASGGASSDIELASETGKAFLAPEVPNGSILVYHGEHEEQGQPYELHSFAWHLLEGLGVGVAAYNTPKNLNALAPNQIVESYLILEHARRDARVKALVWTNTGSRAFNSGQALKGDRSLRVPAEIAKAYHKKGLGPVRNDLVQAQLTKTFWDFEKPVVMAVNGLAVGAGANIALANCGDMVVCSRAARFNWPFAKLGVLPEFGSSMILPFLVGFPKAKELFMTAEWLGAEDAFRLGLVNEICEPEEVIAKAIMLAAKAAKFNVVCMKYVKEVVNGSLRERLGQVLKHEQELFEKCVTATGGFEKNSKL